jgi:hypothetical protein
MQLLHELFAFVLHLLDPGMLTFCNRHTIDCEVADLVPQFPKNEPVFAEPLMQAVEKVFLLFP